MTMRLLLRAGWPLPTAMMLVMIAACADPPQAELDDPDTAAGADALTDGGTPRFGNDTAATDTTTDTQTTDGASAGDTGDAASSGGGSQVTLTFEVDDSANQTYGDADIYWTGSFVWDEKTGEISHTDSWLPEERPWPPLYDDGPQSKGGHEHEGATKGDHIFSTAVTIKTAADVELEYGALNEDLNWMWIGPNGSLVLKKGQTGTVAAKTLKLAKFGDVDVKLELSLDALHANFAKWSAKTHKFFVKGTMNTWTAVQLLDDGKDGDEAAGDGKFTYVQSKRKGSHDGLVSVGDELQFIWVATQGDTLPKDGQEYKGSTAAYPDGVKAWTGTGPGGAWVTATIELKPDSKGKFKNTAIVVPDKAKEPACTPACGADQLCENGKCVEKPCDPACKSGEKCDKAKCVNDFDACTPACETGFECVALKCAEKLCDPSCGSKQKCEKGACLDLLDATKVEPAEGSQAGGTTITITGQGFTDKATVTLSGKACTNVALKDAEHLTCETPKATQEGKVDVVVEQDGETVELKGAFTYKALPAPTVTLTAPVKIAVDEGAEIKGLKAIVKVAGFTTDKGALPGLKVEFGYGTMLTHPVKSTGADAWKWVPATFVSEDTTKGEETWTADLGKLAVGQWRYTARAEFGGKTVVGDADGNPSDSIKIGSMGTATVQAAATGPVVTGFEPPWSKTGGATITILGKNLKKDFAVSLQNNHPQGAQWPFKAGKNVAEVAGGIAVELPPQLFGSANVTVTPPSLPPIVFKDPLVIVPWGTPKLDGTPNFDPFTSTTENPDWDAQGATVVAQNKLKSEWDGAKNDVNVLLVQVDKDNLYVGVLGKVEINNAIVVYLDTDYGAAGGGTQNPVDLKDNKDLVDDLISSSLTVTDSKFGADFALATMGQASFTSGKTAESVSAGWRKLKPIDNFFWETAPVHAKPGVGLEASIPLKTLFPAGVPKTGTTLGFVVAIVNKDGSQAPLNAKLPEQTSAKALVIDKVATVKIFGP